MSANSKKIVVALLLLVVVLGSVAIYWKFFSLDRALAVVGKTEISIRDAGYRDQVVRIYFPEEKRKMGLYQLVKSARNIEILRNHGIEFDHEKIVAEHQRMQSESKDPKMLERIRQVFGKDEEAFLRNFVLPNMADHYIYYEFFLTNPSVQAESLKQANEFIKFIDANNGKDFIKLAEEKNITTDILTLSLKRGMLWDAQVKAQKGRPAGKRPSGMTDPKVAEYLNPDTVKDAETWYDQLIQHMEPGQFFSEPVSMGEAYLVIHYVQKINKDEHKIEVAFFPKQNYSQWYAKEEAKIKSEIYDKSHIPKGL